MKNHQNPSICTHRLSMPVIASTLCVAFSQPIATFADDPDPAASDTKYEFFVGIDVRIPYMDSELPMVDFRNGDVILWSQGKTTALNFNEVKGLRFFRSPKLSRHSVEITNFDAGKTSSKKTTDSEEMMKIMILQNMAEDARDAAYSGLMFGGASKVGNSSSSSGNTSGHSSGHSSGSSSGSSIDGIQSKGYGIGSQGLSHTSEVGNGTSDTIDISYTVASEEPLDDTYALILALVRSSDKDADVQKWVRFQFIGRIDKTPKDFHITQSGMPLNFDLIGAQVFIFSHGEEIANSMSDMRVAVSAENARFLINAGYAKGHKGLSLPPSLATSSIPDDVADLLKGAGVNKDVVLHLDKDANVTSAECDGKPVSDHALNLLKTLIFHPKLKDGEPVASIVQVNINQLSERNLKILVSK